MNTIFGSGYNLYQVLWFFILYAVIGWCIEVIFKSVNTGKFVNRGFLNGPYCPIYGFGAVLVVLLLHPIQDNLLLLFIGSVVVTSALELVTGYLLSALFHTKWWDYSNQPFHIGGYICLQFSLVWGLACVLLVRVIQPLITSFVHLIPTTLGWVLLALCFIALLADCLVTVGTITKLNRDLGAITEIAKGLQKGSDVLAESLGNRAISVADKVGELDLERQKKKITTQFDEGKERVRSAMEESRDRMNAAIENVSQKTSRATRRLLRAFPDMQSRRDNGALTELKKRLGIAKKNTPKPPIGNANSKEHDSVEHPNHIH